MNFKGKIVFGDPPCLKLRPPLERESLPQKTPQKGPQAWPRPSMKMRIFSTEIEGSGWPLVFWVFVFFKFFQDFSATFFIMILVRGGGVIFDFKGKIIFGDPPLPRTPTPHKGKFASKNTPNGGNPRLLFPSFFLRFFMF